MKEFWTISETGLNIYKQLKKEYEPLQLANLLNIFGMIDSVMLNRNRQATDEEYLTIGSACYWGWLKVEEAEITLLTSNVTSAYLNEELTLEELDDYDSRALVEDYYEFEEYEDDYDDYCNEDWDEEE